MLSRAILSERAGIGLSKQKRELEANTGGFKTGLNKEKNMYLIADIVD
jgi:hypothetical protein